MMEHHNCAFPQNVTTPPGASEAWMAATCHFQRARTAETSYDRSTWRPAYRAERRGGSDIPAAVDAEMERLTEARCEAEEALIATSAPDLQAAVWKLQYARRRWAAFEEWPDDWWSSIMADLTRLAALPSIEFDAASWLTQFEAVGGGFIVKPEGVEICFMLHGHPPAAQQEAKRLFDIIDADAVKRAAVRDVVVANVANESGGAHGRA
ncbi:MULTISPECIES: hypothetical protein [Sphingobium]|nr:MULTISPECIES: hypothetical protein [Sphingobium]RYL99499.1 hypothetical protein EWH10_06400 [Sphingobium fuliginis]WDA36680.1 hypothetical protein PO876_00210 [Sphingobium sp. YC-XJ3]